MVNPDSDSAAVRPPLTTYEDLARMVDIPLVAPALSEEEVARGCELAREYGVASVTLRPADVQLAAQWLKGSEVVPAGVVSYPHGASTTAVKNYETRDLLQRGARMIETPLNMGKVVSRQFQYVEMELIQMAQECHRAGATLTLDLEFPMLAPDLRVIACKIAKRSEVDRVRAVSAHGTGRPSREELQFLSLKLGDLTALDAGAWVETLEEALFVYECGATSFQTGNAAAILDAWRAELKRREQATGAGAPEPATPPVI
jgi:deoxyribose-phosphate aldolase